MDNTVLTKNKSLLVLPCLTLLLIILFGCSNDDQLSRNQAKSLLEKKFLKNDTVKTLELPRLDETKRILYINYVPIRKYNEEHELVGYGSNFVHSDMKWLELEKKGFLKIKMVEKKVPNNGGDQSWFLSQQNHFPGKESCPHKFSCSYYDAFSLDFTPAAIPFIRQTERSLALEIAKFDKITITGLTEPSDMQGLKVIQVEYVVEFKPTPIGEIYYTADKAKLLKDSKTNLFVKYDDGWRLE